MALLSKHVGIVLMPLSPSKFDLLDLLIEVLTALASEKVGWKIQAWASTVFITLGARFEVL